MPKTPVHRNCALSRYIKGAILNLKVKTSDTFRLRISDATYNNDSLKDSCTLQIDVRV